LAFEFYFSFYILGGGLKTTPFGYRDYISNYEYQFITGKIMRNALTPHSIHVRMGNKLHLIKTK
jgi:hypothetical protein